MQAHEDKKLMWVQGVNTWTNRAILHHLHMGGSMTSPWGSNEPPDLIPKETLYIIFNFFISITKILNTPTLNFLLSPIEINLNMILIFYVFLVFLYIQSSSLINALHISKSKKYFSTLRKQKFITKVLFFLVSRLLSVRSMCG